MMKRQWSELDTRPEAEHRRVTDIGLSVGVEHVLEVRLQPDAAEHSRPSGNASSCPVCMDRLPFASEVVLSEVADMYPAC